MFSQTRRRNRLDSVVSGRFKLIRNADTKRVTLYDWKRDPDEHEEVAARYPEVVVRLEQGLSSWLEEMARATADYEPARPVELSPAEIEQLKGLGYIDP